MTQLATIRDWEEAEIERSIAEARHTPVDRLRMTEWNLKRYLDPPADTPYPNTRRRVTLPLCQKSRVSSVMVNSPPSRSDKNRGRRHERHGERLVRRRHPAGKRKS